MERGNIVDASFVETPMRNGQLRVEIGITGTRTT